MDSCIYNCSYQTGQFLKTRLETLDLSKFLVNNLQLVGFLVLAYLLIAVTTTLLPRLVHANCSSRLKSLRLILCRALFIDHSRLPSVHLRLIFFSFTLFLFFWLNFLGGSIRTDKTTKPTDEIVDSPAKLLSTSKRLAVSDKDLELLMTAPEGSYLKRLFSKKKVDRVNGLRGLLQMKIYGINHFVIFGERVAVSYAVDLLSEHAKRIDSVAFAKSTDYYELLGAFWMLRALDKERKRFINSK